MKQPYIPIGCDQQGRINPTTRRFPRTIQEAFGPYECGNIGSELETPPMDWQDRVVAWACALAVVAVLVILNWPQ